MGGDVQTHRTRSSNIMVSTSGVRLAARRVVCGRVDLRNAAREGRAYWQAQRSQSAGYLRGEIGSCVGIEAFVVARIGREPSFYLGFWEPLLRSELREGIAYGRGLHHWGGPDETWMLTLEPCSPSGKKPVAGCRRAPLDLFSTSTSVSCYLRCRAGS